MRFLSSTFLQDLCSYFWELRERTTMKIDRFMRFVLTLIALFLGIIALRPWSQPATVQARDSSSSENYSGSGFSVFVEPGVTTLHASDGSKHVVGKVEWT